MSVPQHMAALAKANETRIAAAATKREVKAGRPVADLLLDPPDHMWRVRVYDLLMCQPRFGDSRASRLMRDAGVRYGMRIEGLTVRQRRALVDGLR